MTVSAVAQKRNVLFIAVDDLKPLIGAYGDDLAITPNMDRLAKMGVTFTNAHCQQAVCGPSRASLLTGLRPNVTEVWDLKTLIRDKNPNILTLPQHFKKNGYSTIGMGKIFDPRSVDKGYDKASWSETFIMPDKLDPVFGDAAMGSYQSEAYKKRFSELQAQGKAQGLASGKLNKYIRDNFKPSTESADVQDKAYFDGIIGIKAVEALEELAGNSQPFFLAVGFKKPHLPFVAPQKYWDMYDRDQMPLAEFQNHARNTLELSYHKNGELRSYTDIEGRKGVNDPLPKNKQLELIHGYYACITYIAALIGKLIDALEANELTSNTSIVLWGDHGWHLGDHGLWNKHSNFEQATRVPLIFVDATGVQYKQNSSPVEFVDVFPTLCDLAGIEKPKLLQGTSLVPILKGKKKNVKDFAVSQYGRGENEGYALRTDRYRLVLWYRGGDTSSESNILFKELYDYKKDPLEKANVVADYPEIAAKLQAQLTEHLRLGRKFKQTYSSSSRKPGNAGKPSGPVIMTETFENGFNKEWIKFGPIKPSVDATHGVDRSSCVALGSDKSGFKLTLTELQPLTEYQVEIWMRADKGLRTALKASGHGQEEVTKRLVGNGEFQSGVLTFKTGESNTTADLTILRWITDTSAMAYVDNLTVTQLR